MPWSPENHHLRDLFRRRFSLRRLTSWKILPSTMLSPGAKMVSLSSYGIQLISLEICFLNILNTTISPASFVSSILTYGYHFRFIQNFSVLLGSGFNLKIFHRDSKKLYRIGGSFRTISSEEERNVFSVRSNVGK